MSFSPLGLSKPIVDAVNDKGYETPTPIQQEAIPAILSRQDVMAAAQTGTGKTAGFTLPLLEILSSGEKAKGNQVRALVLTPTRELAAQVAENLAWYRKNLPLTSTAVFGGVKINPQMQKLRKGCDVLVATPGRLLDLYQQNAVRFDHLEVLVLDEADRMLDMGFIHDIKRILKALPAKRQNLLFSATFSEEIRALAKGLVKDPIEISVTPRNATAKTVEQWIYPVDKSKKSKLLSVLIHENKWEQILVFSRTKHGANRLAKYLEKNDIKALAIHGDKSQGSRTRALESFKSGSIQVLVATDIAARGIDIDLLPYVVNFDLPHVSEDYVHRIGRTGRAGSTGVAVSLVSIDEFKQLKDIQRLTKQVFERKVVEGFEPEEPLPETKLDTRPFKPKKPKKNQSKPTSERTPRKGYTGNKGGQQAKSKKKGQSAEGQEGKTVARSGQGAKQAGDDKPRRTPTRRQRAAANK